MAHSELASPSATLAVLKQHGLHTRKALGQHFLVDDNAVGRIIDLASLAGDEHIVEVGPGIGTLTLALARAAGSVVTVESDDRLLGVLAELTERYDNVRVVHADALDVTPDDLGGPAGQAPVALVANLPYAVAATVVLRFFEMLPTIQSATVMVQAEVADRMSAVPGTKDYGAYTVKLAMFARTTGRFSVGRGCFLPPPRVDSTVIRLERIVRDDSPEEIGRAIRAANAAFAQRRKTMRNSISSALGVSAASVEDSLSAAGLDPAARAESLRPESFVILGRALHESGLLP
ncbi:MAG: 16S rRNA (adenine(1518)-N(6)/adenine(1519)-N(6))-dimethyltransferase RsmA [Coriobacteriia bacterium]